LSPTATRTRWSCSSLRRAARDGAKRLIEILRAQSGCARVYERSDTEGRELEGSLQAPADRGARPTGRSRSSNMASAMKSTPLPDRKPGSIWTQRDNRRRRGAPRRWPGGCSIASPTRAVALSALARRRAPRCSRSTVRACARVGKGDNLALNGSSGAGRVARSRRVGALRKLQREGRQFDFIVLDPPKFATDTERRRNAPRARLKDIQPECPEVCCGGRAARDFFPARRPFRRALQKIRSPAPPADAGASLLLRERYRDCAGPSGAHRVSRRRVPERLVAGTPLEARSCVVPSPGEWLLCNAGRACNFATFQLAGAPSGLHGRLAAHIRGFDSSNKLVHRERHGFCSAQVPGIELAAQENMFTGDHTHRLSLGSGKTTAHQPRPKEQHGHRIAVIENDSARPGVDNENPPGQAGEPISNEQRLRVLAPCAADLHPHSSGVEGRRDLRQARVRARHHRRRLADPGRSRRASSSTRQIGNYLSLGQRHHHGRRKARPAAHRRSSTAQGVQSRPTILMSKTDLVSEAEQEGLRKRTGRK